MAKGRKKAREMTNFVSLRKRGAVLDDRDNVHAVVYRHAVYKCCSDYFGNGEYHRVDPATLGIDSLIEIEL